MSGDILRLLGAPAHEGDSAPHRFAAERVYQVIVYLACKQDWVQRGVLAALFYGEHPEEAALRKLRKLLLRHARSIGTLIAGISLMPRARLADVLERFPRAWHW